MQSERGQKTQGDGNRSSRLERESQRGTYGVKCDMLDHVMSP